MSILEELEWRELFADCTDKAELSKRLAAPLTLYCGFDPTADSLHVGNLVPLLALRRFQFLGGHRPIALAGGATGSIGDPSGKSQERQLLTKEVLDYNISRVKEQLQRLLDFNATSNPAVLLDNASWTAPVSYLEFLRDIGKHFSVNQMVAKESVRARMEDRESGISYTEFSYMLLQAFDFYVLCRDHNCELQIGGSDQWGNITAGIELARKKLGKTVYGLTLPLITNADGSKFGKTVAGAVWLDAKKTSVYHFYQFWINTDDRDVIRYLKFFTFLSREEIAALAAKHAENPGAREAHRALATEVTSLVHGKSAALGAQRTSEIFFGNKSVKELMEQPLESIKEELRQDEKQDGKGASEPLLGINPKQSLKELYTQPLASIKDELRLENSFEDASKGMSGTSIEKAKFEGAGMPLVELLVYSGLYPSKGQARKGIEGGGVYINNVRETNFQKVVTSGDFEVLFGKHLLLRKGKKDYVVINAT